MKAENIDIVLDGERMKEGMGGEGGEVTRHREGNGGDL